MLFKKSIGYGLVFNLMFCSFPSFADSGERGVPLESQEETNTFEFFDLKEERNSLENEEFLTQEDALTQKPRSFREKAKAVLET